MPLPELIESSSCAESVERVPKLTSFSTVCRMCSAEICFNTSVMCGSAAAGPGDCPQVVRLQKSQTATARAESGSIALRRAASDMLDFLCEPLDLAREETKYNSILSVEESWCTVLNARLIWTLRKTRLMKARSSPARSVGAILR